jgi:hypothetical protein
VRAAVLLRFYSVECNKTHCHVCVPCNGLQRQLQYAGPPHSKCNICSHVILYRHLVMCFGALQATSGGDMCGPQCPARLRSGVQWSRVQGRHIQVSTAAIDFFPFLVLNLDFFSCFLSVLYIDSDYQTIATVQSSRTNWQWIWSVKTRWMVRGSNPPR